MLIRTFFAAASVLAPLAAAVAATEVPWPSIALGGKIAIVEKPTHIAHAGDGSRRLFITEQRGRVVIVRGGVQQEAPFLDIRDRVSCCGERGLLFHRDMAENGRTPGHKALDLHIRRG